MNALLGRYSTRPIKVFKTKQNSWFASQQHISNEIGTSDGARTRRGTVKDAHQKSENLVEKNP